MAGRYRPVDTGQSFPALEERVLVGGKNAPSSRRAWSCAPANPEWVFYEGPPTANGKPGVHHVLARVFKDIYPRYKTMRGYYVGRKAGWDCHGLPVELEIEKRLGFDHKEQIEAYGVAEFNRLCRESVTAYVDDWNRMTERIGMWLDLDDPYMTMTDGYIESVWWILSEFAKQGLLYEGYKVVPYCPRCGTALSSHEVASGLPAGDRPLGLRALPALAGSGGRRAGLGPGDRAVAGPGGRSWRGWSAGEPPGLDHHALDPHLQRGRGRGSRHPVRPRPAGRRASDPGRRPGRRSAGPRRGRRGDLPGLGAGGAPLPGRPTASSTPDKPAWRVIAADFVATDEGTGIVHIAPAFGADDMIVGQANDLPVIMPVDEEARFTAEVTPWAGVFVKDADAGIMDELESRGLLFARQPYEHNYPFCWRCDTPLIYYAKTSWYVRTTARKDDGAGRQRRGHLVSRAPQARPLRQVAGEQHRLVALPRPLLGHPAACMALLPTGTTPWSAPAPS